MSNLKRKISYRVTALALALLMLASLIPASVIASALDELLEDPFKAKGFVAVYNAEADTVDLAWDAFETEPYELYVNVGTEDNKTKIDAAATSYTYSCTAGGKLSFKLIAYKDATDTTGVESDAVTVSVPGNFAGLPALGPIDDVANGEDIGKLLPTSTKVLVDGGTEVDGNHTLTWDLSHVDYKDSAEAQVLTINGTVTLDKSKAQNRNNLSLATSIQVNVAAAVNVALTTDLDDSAAIEKKVGEKLTLSVEASGTAPAYQWYKKAEGEADGAAIDGETNASLTIDAVALGDAGIYYCVVTGKTGEKVTSKEATVNVVKNDVKLQLSISPAGGQTRPNSIEIEVLNVPVDAKGSVTIKQGNDIIHNVTLDGSNDEAIKYTFTATGPNDHFVFSAYYSGDEKYNKDDVLGVEYDFTKGTQNKPTISGVPSDVKALDTFEVTVSGVETANDQYTITVSNPVDSTVAQIVQTSGNKATIKVLKKGEFTIKAFANGNNDYNASELTEQPVNADYAARSGLKFDSSDATQAYMSGFAFTMGYTDSSKGDEKLVFSIDWDKTTAKGVAIDENTGRIYYIYDHNTFEKNFAGTVGEVTVVVTKKSKGVYKPLSDTYTLTITKGAQAPLRFSIPSPEAIVYSEIDADKDKTGTKFPNPVSDTEKGTVNSALSYAIVSQTTLDGEKTTGVAGINPLTGEITALKSGIIVVKATRPGNNMYEDTSYEYTLTINRGTVETGASGFHFETGDSTIKYGFVGFANKAAGGQSDASAEVIYSVDKDHAAEVSVSNNGVISFIKEPAEAATETYTVVVTATKPQTDKYLEQSISYTLTVTRDAVHPATDFLVNGEVIKDATKNTSPDGWYNAAHENITITPKAPYTLISENGTEWETSLERTNDEKHAIMFYLKDKDGNTTLLSTTQHVNYDKTPAEAKLTVVDDDGNFWDKFWETITFGLWKKESKKITIDATDNLSGIMSIEYYEQNSNFRELSAEVSIEDIVKDFEWKSCEITRNDLTANGTVDVTLPALSNKKVVVYAKVTDYAGNVSYFRTDGMVFDNITPTQNTDLPDPLIEIKLDENGNEGLYNAEVPFTVTVNDEQTDAVASGIKDITVTIKGSTAESYEKIVTVKAKKSEINSFNSADVDENEFTVNGTFVVPADFDSNYLTINVVVTDYAGNTYNNTVPTHLALDRTAPVIEVSYNDQEDTFSNGKYIGNNKNRVATIDITELNFDSSAVQITVTQDEKKLDIKPSFTAIEGKVDENGDQIGWRMTIDYATLGEGDFTFDVAYTDKANNANNGWAGDDVAVNKSFTIDNTKPVIRVVISNDAVQNGKYFAADRTAIVTIIERNFSETYQFDWTGLTLSLDGKALTAPTPKITKNDDGTYERVYTIDFSAEGDYTFDVKYTDLADNLADTYSCSSVAYKEFTVDKTAPALDITGVADQSANSGDVAPVITYSDVNFNKDAVSIALAGINNGTVQYNGEFQNAGDGHGQTYTYANFEKVQKVDDIYTLTVKLTDMAGNETEKTISFSVNRFGSVYDISAIGDMINKYLQAEQDLVFTETNVDALDREGIKIKLTKNGTPTDLVEGTDYTVEVTGGNGKWSVYKYTVKKALFADDGRYSLTIYSKDAAGNVNENIDETKKAEISFGIDKTNPVIVPIDFEAGKQYAVDLKTVSVEIKDNLVLEDVKIYLNGKEIEYTADGETYTFDIPKSNSKQDVKIVTTDAAGNEEVIEVTDFLVNTNIFVRWFNNTPLFVGSIIGAVVLALGVTVFLVFFKKKKKEDGDQ